MVNETRGDLLNADVEIKVHQTNIWGIMGAGIAAQIREKYPKVNKEYVDWCENHAKDGLIGTIFVCKAEDGSRICNMFSQNVVARDATLTNYGAFKECLKLLHEYMEKRDIRSVGFPKYIGCGIAGGNWSVIEPLIRKEFEEDEKVNCMIVEFG